MSVYDVFDNHIGFMETYRSVSKFKYHLLPIINCVDKKVIHTRPLK